jgi:hypothetical protein
MKENLLPDESSVVASAFNTAKRCRRGEDQSSPFLFSFFLGSEVFRVVRAADISQKEHRAGPTIHKGLSFRTGPKPGEELAGFAISDVGGTDTAVDRR